MSRETGEPELAKGDTVQTTLLGLAIAFIVALLAALIGPHFIDWNQFRPQFEAEATRVVGAPVRVTGELDARLLPTPSLRLRSVVVGGANDLGKVRADKLDVEFSLGSLMRGDWRATELTINGVALDLGLDSLGRIDWPLSSGKLNIAALSIDRLNLTGRVALHDAASGGTVELNDIAFSGDVRSLAGSMRGDGNFTLSGSRYPFRVSSGQIADGSGTRVHLNVDPGTRALAVDLDGVLGFEGRAPRFEGGVVLAVPTGLKAAGDVPITPWRIAGKIKADPSAARIDQIEASYGAQDSTLQFAGAAEIRFGPSPLLRADVSARQLDADRIAGKLNSPTDAVKLLAGLRVLAIPQLPIPAQIGLAVDQIMLGGRPLQNVTADLRAGDGSWSINRLEFRAPGATQVGFVGANAQPGPSGGLRGALTVDSSDPDALVTWLQGRSEMAYRSQKALRVSGNISADPNALSIEAMKAELDGDPVQGRLALSYPPAGGSRFEAELKAERLNLDAAAVLARSLAGPQAEWPQDARMSLDIGRAGLAGQEWRPFAATFGYSAKAFYLEHLKLGDASRLAMEASGTFDRVDATGKLALNLNAASLDQIAGLLGPLAPGLGPRLASAKLGPGPANLKFTLDIDKNAPQDDRGSARAVFDLDAPQLKGTATITAKPDLAAIHGIDLNALQHSGVNIESRLSAGSGRSLLALLGLDRIIAAGNGPAQFDGTVTGAWQKPLWLQARISGTDLEAEAQGTTDLLSPEPSASISLAVRKANFSPLFDAKPSDPLAQNVKLSSRVSLAGKKLMLDDLDAETSGSRLLGHVALTLDDQRRVDGEVGLDALDLAPAFAVAIGAAGHDATEPLGSGLMKGWRGRIGFQALRGRLPGVGEVGAVSGTIKSDGQSLSLDELKAAIGGGEASASIDARPSGTGVALNARVELRGVDGAALRYRKLSMPPGRASLQMTLTSQGRSASALTSAASGSGALTLESAVIAGLNPRAFEVAMRASDNGQATNDTKLRQIIEPVLSAGALPLKSAQIPFTIREGRLRIAATTLDAEGARAIVSGGYDIAADQADIRVILASTAVEAGSHPEIQLFAAGSPDGLNRTIDVGALSSWLAVRAIDRETRRLDSMERGEAPTASIPAAVVQSPAASPDAAHSDQPNSESPALGRDTRRPALKPKVSAPRQPAANPGAAGANRPVLSQQQEPLPPATEVRPAPGAVARPSKPKLPLMLVPPFTAPGQP
jgi:uncharacterized protein involved in outer membrane biogenesis